MKCHINDKIVEAKVTENMGFQGGVFVKAIEYKGKEYIVCKYNGIWRQRKMKEKIRPMGQMEGQ